MSNQYIQLNFLFLLPSMIVIYLIKKSLVLTLTIVMLSNAWPWINQSSSISIFLLQLKKMYFNVIGIDLKRWPIISRKTEWCNLKINELITALTIGLNKGPPHNSMPNNLYNMSMPKFTITTITVVLQLWQRHQAISHWMCANYPIIESHNLENSLQPHNII